VVWNSTPYINQSINLFAHLFIIAIYILYNFIRHIGSHIQYKKAIYSKQNDEKVNNSVTIFNNTFE